MMSSLQHCLTLFHQQEDIRVLQLKQEQEKCRVLEEALNVLAKEHHELEQSVVCHISETGTIPHSLSCKSSRIFDTDDEFFDVDSDTDTLVTADSIFNSPVGSQIDLHSDFAAVCSELMPHQSDASSASESSSSSSSSSTAMVSEPQSGASTYHTQSSGSFFTTESKRKRSKSSADSNSSSNSSDTLVGTMSIASSCATLISEGGDSYRCARSEFSGDHHNQNQPLGDLIDLRAAAPFR